MKPVVIACVVIGCVVIGFAGFFPPTRENMKKGTHESCCHWMCCDWMCCYFGFREKGKCVVIGFGVIEFFDWICCFSFFHEGKLTTNPMTTCEKGKI